MSKRTYITNITPLPTSVSRDAAIAMLHDHQSMIELNPLVLRFETSTPPPNASKDEAEYATWYEITDRINYLPGGTFKGQVSYKACFYNLPAGLQTHVFAPAGVEIRSKWSVGGNEPGEPKETRELGLNVPSEGLYIKEEVDLRCNMFMSNFVKKNLKKSHLVVADKIVARANLMKRPSIQSSHSRQRHSASRSLENVNWQPVFVTQQTSSESGIPRQLQPGSVSSLPRCMCERIPHQLSCPFSGPDRATPLNAYERRRSLPFNATSLPSGDINHSQPTRPTLLTQQDRRPSELHGSAGSNSCLCTGGLHEYGCLLYPGLRLTISPTSPFRDPLSSSNVPVPPLRNPLRRPSENTAQLFTAQRLAEQAELRSMLAPDDSSTVNEVARQGPLALGSAAPRTAVADGSDAARFPRSTRTLR